MNTIFKIIAFPVTLLISVACFLFAMMFQTSFGEKDGVGVFNRISREASDLIPMRWWRRQTPIFKAIISGILYHIILF